MLGLIGNYGIKWVAAAAFKRIEGCQVASLRSGIYERTGGDSTSFSAYGLAVVVKSAADSHRAAIAVTTSTNGFKTTVPRGSHLSHASSNRDVTARAFITATDTSSPLTASSRYSSARDEDVTAFAC